MSDAGDTVRRIRDLKRKTTAPVIIMASAHHRELLDKESAQEVDLLLDGYLIKPITASMLRDAVDEAVAGRKDAHSSRRTRPTSVRLSGMKLLVVEDNPLNQQIAAELLSNWGAQVEVATGGLNGVDRALAADPPYDAILMDLQMPDIDGLEATRRLRVVPRMRTIPIIAMTANALASDRDACLAVGMVDHIGKPFDLDELIGKICLHVGRDLHPLPSLVGFTKSDATNAHEIDLDGALERLAGNRELYQLLANKFPDEAHRLVTELERYLVMNSWPDAVRCLHTLKGIAGTMGATALAELAANGEEEINRFAGADASSDLPGSRNFSQLMAELKIRVDQSIVQMSQSSTTN